MRKFILVLVILSALAVTPSFAGAAPPSFHVEGTVNPLTYNEGYIGGGSGYADLEGYYHGNIFDGYYVDINMDLINSNGSCASVNSSYADTYISLNESSGMQFRVSGTVCVNDNAGVVTYASLTLTAVQGYGQFTGYGGTLHASLASAQGPLSIYGTITPGLTNGNNCTAVGLTPCGAPVRPANGAGAHR